ncbi:MAG TPA: CapA family protein, partial [Candidatus Binatia bacterium]|nr:CapA family protein [Candidatus Binatia bacterium]
MVIAVPTFWELEAREAAATLARSQQWRVQPADDPDALLRRGKVQAALVPDDGGFFAGARPIALAVPFSSDWEDVTFAEAQEIQRNGHAIISLLPADALVSSQRALTIDGTFLFDADYPLQQPWSVHAAEEAAEPAALFASALQDGTNGEDVKIAAVGDIMLDRSLGAAIAAGDIRYPFAFVAAELQDADFTVGNLECAVGDVGEAASKSYTFRAPPNAARSLAQAGIDLVTLANNHAMDFGPSALLQGIGLLRGAGIATVGAGADLEEARRAHVVIR